MMKKILTGVVMAGVLSSTAFATPTRFTFTDPAFGGNPLNASYILNMVESQKQIKEDAPAGTGTGQPSLAESFQQQLQARLLSALASQITGQIYGNETPTEGTYVIGDLSVTYKTVGNSVEITLNDGTGSTVIKVPRTVQPQQP